MRLREGLPAYTRSAISFSVEVTDPVLFCADGICLSKSFLLEFTLPKGREKKSKVQDGCKWCSWIGWGRWKDWWKYTTSQSPASPQGEKHLEKGEGGAQPSPLHRSSAALWPFRRVLVPAFPFSRHVQAVYWGLKQALKDEFKPFGFLGMVCATLAQRPWLELGYEMRGETQI